MRPFRRFIERLLPAGRFARNVSVLAGGTALSQAFSVLAAPLLTRLYRAEDFGYFQVYLSFMSFAILAVTLRFDQAIFLPDREEVAANLVGVTLGAVLLVSALCGGMLWSAMHYHLLPVAAAGLNHYLWLIPLSMCGAGVYQTFSVWALRHHAYSRVTATKVTQVLSMLGAQTVVGALHTGPLGLLLGDAIGRANGSLSLARLSWQQSRDAFRSMRWQTMCTTAARYRRFPMVSTGSALISIAGYALPMLLLAQFYGPKTLGWFALGDRVMAAPSLLIGQAVAQVFSVEAAAFASSNPEALRPLFFRLARRLVVLGIVPCVGLVVSAPYLFSIVFGEAWREAGVYARLVAAMHYVAFVAAPLMPTLNILEEQFLQLAWDVGRLAMSLTSLWLAYHLGLSARGAIAVVATVLLVAYAVHLLLCHFAIGRRVRRFRSSKPGPVVIPDYPEFGDSRGAR
jgi:O-antigen/teichoic acid export membrane protein